MVQSGLDVLQGSALLGCGGVAAGKQRDLMPEADEFIGQPGGGDPFCATIEFMIETARLVEQDRPYGLPRGLSEDAE